MKNKINSNREFIAWLKARDPFLYAVAARAEQLKNEKPNLSGLAGFDFASFVKTATDTIKDVAPKLMEYKAQLKVLRTNVSRAERDLPPLDVASYTSVLPQYNPNNPTPEQQRLIDSMAMQSVQKTDGSDSMLPIILLGAGAYYFMNQ